jgi:dihydrolipoamide dehydrogenase
VNAEDEKILGFHFLGAQADNLIHEVVVAMNAGDGTIQALIGSIHIHPTLSEAVKSAAKAAR